jgi:hypothetical protein
LKILKHVEVEMNDPFGFITRMGTLSFDEGARDGEQTVGGALHRRHNDDHVCAPRSRADKVRGMHHALGSEQRAAAKLEGDDTLVSACLPNARGDSKSPSKGSFRFHIFLHVFGTHDIRSWFPLERLWRGFKRRNPPPSSLQAVGWKLFLTC